MNKMPLICAHYTKNTGYEKEVGNLIKSLDEFRLSYDIEAIDSLGSWRANSNYCAENIRKMLYRHPTTDILRVDADAVFKRCPDVFLQDDFNPDVAAHIHDFKWHEQELLGGTLFFRNIPEVRWMVENWAWESRVNRSDERNPDLLKEIIDSKKFNINFLPLPETYCTIFDIMADVKEPVIVHYQASRRLKRMVDRKVKR